MAVNFQMRMRVADWHGNQAANAYMDWQRIGLVADMDKYVRHALIADRLWSSPFQRQS